MAIVITDGLHYIRYNEHGGTRTTQKIDNAFQCFLSSTFP